MLFIFLKTLVMSFSYGDKKPRLNNDSHIYNYYFITKRCRCCHIRPSANPREGLVNFV